MVELIRKGLVALIVVAMVPLLVFLPDGRAAERIDRTFAEDGSWVEEYWGDLLLKRDSRGRILVLDPWRTPTLTRLLPNGSVDPAFAGRGHEIYLDGASGKTIARYEWGLEPVLRGGVNPLVATAVGSGRHSTGLYAVTSRGRLSMNFYDAGLWLFGGFSAQALLPAPGGATLLAGQLNVSDRKPGIARIIKVDRGSNPIKSFGNGGEVRIRSNRSSRAHQFIDLSYVNGGIVALGYLNNRLAVLKLDRRGRRVKSFGNDGLLRLPVRSPDGCSYLCFANSMSLDSAGSGFLLGLRGKRGRSIVAAVHGSGKVNRHFGAKGIVDLDSLPWKANGFWATDLERDRAGVVITGNLAFPADDEGRVPTEGILLRLTASGQLDKRFGNNGVFRIPDLTEASSLEKVKGGFLVGGHIQPLDRRTIFGVVTKVLVDR